MAILDYIKNAPKFFELFKEGKMALWGAFNLIGHKV